MMNNGKICECRLVVILQEKTYIYDLNSLTILDTIDTVPNTKGQYMTYFLLFKPPVKKERYCNYHNFNSC